MAGGGGGGEMDDLVAAQKDVVSATWKLERRSAGGRSASDIRAVGRAQAEVRDKLKQQSASAAPPSPAPRRRRGIEPAEAEAPPVPLQAAGEAMDRAVTQLEKLDTRSAITHEMDALNQLLKAEAEIRRRQLARQQSGQGGGRGRSGNEDLSALFDQELMRQQTNYQQQNSVESRQESTKGASALDKIRELARRQDDLAREQQQLARERSQMSVGRGQAPARSADPRAAALAAGGAAARPADAERPAAGPARASSPQSSRAQQGTAGRAGPAAVSRASRASRRRVASRGRRGSPRAADSRRAARRPRHAIASGKRRSRWARRRRSCSSSPPIRRRSAGRDRPRRCATRSVHCRPARPASGSGPPATCSSKRANSPKRSDSWRPRPGNSRSRRVGRRPTSVAVSLLESRGASPIAWRRSSARCVSSPAAPIPYAIRSARLRASCSEARRASSCRGRHGSCARAARRRAPTSRNSSAMRPACSIACRRSPGRPAGVAAARRRRCPSDCRTRAISAIG